MPEVAEERELGEVVELLDTCFPLKRQVVQVLLGLQGPTLSAHSRFASQRALEPKCCPSWSRSCPARATARSASWSERQSIEVTDLAADVVVVGCEENSCNKKERAVAQTV